MANTTFNGPVRSENGFKTIDVASSTGVVTDGLVINADGNIYTDDGAHIQYAAATGVGPSDLIIGKSGSQYGTANPYAESATALFPLGSKMIYGNNVYRYVGIGGTAVTAGKLLQQPAVVSDHANMAATAAVAAGETAISVETGALMGATVIDLTADYFGWAVISGPAALLTVGTLVVGNAAVRSGGTAGGVAPATDNVLMEVGDVMAVSANTEYSLIMMNLS